MKLTTPQTEHLIAQYPEIEFLEAGHVPEWLSCRKDQLLIFAKQERIGSSLAKTVGLATAAVGVVCWATSPMAPFGAALGIMGYAWGLVADTSTTHTFNPIPFIRGGVLDVIGSMGHSEARKEFLQAYDEFEQLKEHLPPVERQEYQMLRLHMALVTEYLAQVEAGKRFYAYRWLTDQYILLHGSFPSINQVQAHAATIQYVSPLVDSDRIRAIQDASKPVKRPLIMDLPKPNIVEELPKPNIVEKVPTDVSAIYTYNPSDHTQIDLINELTDNITNTLIIGAPKAGKGMLVSNALRAAKAKHPDLNVFVIDPKASVRELGYWEGVADVVKRFPCENQPDEVILDFVERSFNDYYEYVNQHGRTLLFLDEGVAVGSAAERLKNPIIQNKITSIASLGDESGKNIWIATQSPFVNGLGIKLSAASQMLVVAVINENNLGTFKQWSKSAILEKISVEELSQLTKNSPCNRAVYFGKTGKWYSMPKLHNYSGFDRDTRTFLPGLTPPPKGEKLVSDNNVVAKLEETLKVELLNDSETEENSFDFNKAVDALRSLQGKGWIKFGEARSNSKPLRKQTRDADDVRLIVSFLVKDGVAEIKDGDYFQIKTKAS